MEIEQFMTEYRNHSPEDFFNWLAKGRVLEVRFLSDFEGKKFANWELIRHLAEMMGVESRFNGLFISTFKQLRAILLFKLPLLDKYYPLTKIYNIYISANPKRKIDMKSKAGLLYKSYFGGIAGTSHIQTILCDIEHIGQRSGSATESMLLECIQGAKYLVKQLELTDYYINVSGNGTHLWIAMNPALELPVPSFTEFDDKLKYNMKEEPINTFIKTYNRFIEKLDVLIKKFNVNLMVDDGAKDISRIARPTGSWNVKAGKTARAVGTVLKDNKFNKYINKQFAAAKPVRNKKAQEYQERQSQSKHHRYNALNIKSSPLYNLMVSRLLPSTLSRNHYLEQSFARLLRDNNMSPDEITEAISEMDVVQQKSIQIDPEYLDDDLPFNPETINNYCYECKIDFVYKIMEDVPDITADYLSDEEFNKFNKYTEISFKSQSLKDSTKLTVDSYFKLKMVIRQLIDAYPRSVAFFTIKDIMHDDWEFLFKNKVIQTIMNKTRKRVGD